MRVRTYGMITFSVEKIVGQVKGKFLDEKITLEYRMKRIERWQKRLDQLKDPQMVPKIQALVEQFQTLSAKHGIVWSPALNDRWNSQPEVKYVKGDVSLDLYVDLNVTPEKLWANFYSKKNNAAALRIHIGKSVRVTDKILSCILNGKS